MRAAKTRDADVTFSLEWLPAATHWNARTKPKQDIGTCKSGVSSGWPDPTRAAGDSAKAPAKNAAHRIEPNKPANSAATRRNTWTRPERDDLNKTHVSATIAAAMWIFWADTAEYEKNQTPAMSK
mmetsp:Transcript_79495/g.221204  ORF Transcript_79495/g.221204 Transcript_79495/m.221204 type:complete len:125 (-) Transcript_79495:1106-1480(-)